MKLSELLREHADIIDQRADNSRRTHPEFATPSELAFWLRSYRQLAGEFATDLRNQAEVAKMREDCWHG